MRARRALRGAQSPQGSSAPRIPHERRVPDEAARSEALSEISSCFQTATLKSGRRPDTW
jgi:hypothetical protein